MPRSVIQNLRSRGFEKLHVSMRDGTIDDLSGNGGIGAFNGGSSIAKTEHNFGLILDGTSGYLDYGDPGSGIYDFGTNPYTVCLWAKFPRLPGDWDILIGKKGPNAADPGFLWRYQQAGLRFLIAFGDASSQVVYNWAVDHIWHHFAVTRDGTTGTMYRDGLFAATGVAASIANDQNNAVTLKIGWLNGWGFSSCMFDEVFLYNNYAMSASEISQHYGETHPWGVP
jgi:hypothetical protein